ncbi:MAG: 2-phospho-L-lactate transferase [Pseudomonadales bacterium]
MSKAKKILALSGGVGGAKLATGLAAVLAPDELCIVANTADDFIHLGLSISPDLDTVMYNLAGLNNKQQGWGLAGESWQFMESLKRLGGEDWFLLGDQDLATHIQRSALLNEGKSLTEVTALLAHRLDLAPQLLPMTNDRVSTRMVTDQGDLSFQHYFVRERCEPVVSAYYFEGIDGAQPQEDFIALLQDPDLAAIIICPSNPFVSVEPILSLAGVTEHMKESPAPVIAVSPIIAGQALKGPAAKMMSELNMPCSATAVAALYGDLLDGFVIDTEDAALLDEIRAGGIPAKACATIMRSMDSKKDLAREVLSFAEELMCQP